MQIKRTVDTLLLTTSISIGVWDDIYEDKSHNIVRTNDPLDENTGERK
jgi:hypothetical protein